MIDDSCIRLIKYGTAEYEEELLLRNLVLRKPLGLSIYDDNLDKEKTDWHIGYFLTGGLVGVLVLTVNDKNEVKMRQVAVSECYRGKNIGTELVNYSEKFVRNNGYNRLVLNSRKTAVGFYEKLNYKIISNEFMEVSIPHYKMQKDL